MKLIDKDKLHLTYKQGTYVGHGIYDGEGYYVDGNEVANAPIVKAVPFKWIEKYVQKLNTILKDNLDLGEEGPTDEIAAIESMLSVWETENEQNKENISQTD